VYLRKYVKYDAAQRVDMNHNEDSLFMALRMDYCYVWFITQNVWSRFQIARGQSSFLRVSSSSNQIHKVLKPF